MKHSPWNSHHTGVNSYAVYPGERYCQPAVPFFAAGCKRVLWPTGWLLTPALLGIVGASVLGFGTADQVSDSEVRPDNAMSASCGSNHDNKAAFLANIDTTAATAGISLYIIENLFVFQRNNNLRRSFW